MNAQVTIKRITTLQRSLSRLALILAACFSLRTSVVCFVRQVSLRESCIGGYHFRGKFISDIVYATFGYLRWTSFIRSFGYSNIIRVEADYSKVREIVVSIEERKVSLKCLMNNIVYYNNISRL